MTTSATQEDTARRLDELEALERDAWGHYREELRLLEGEAYREAEPAAWDALRATLDEVGAERAAIDAGAPAEGGRADARPGGPNDPTRPRPVG